MKPHSNKGNRYAAKPPTRLQSLRIPETDYQEFIRQAGGNGRKLTKWILQKLKS